MRVVETVRELQALADAERAAARRIALVPTMGALHAGHLSLIKQARQAADLVWVSIFVNPTQFDRADDLARYPKPLERDLAACRDAGVDLVFAPAAGEIYRDDAETWVEVSELAKPLCGATRPGHFRGVTTVVSKLFLSAKPHVAVFGEKDFQQLAVIRRMARDLCFDVEILGAPIVREPDGLALSSRNERLDPASRREAVAISRALDAAESAVADGECDAGRVLALVRAALAAAPRARIDYAELRDLDSLAEAPAHLESETLLALAVVFPVDDGPDPAMVRLIDNRVLRPRPRPIGSRPATA
jgi:pantoate--beta-alanine ligase